MTENGKKNPEKERPPKFVPSLTGRVISYGGLVERIVKQFHEEYDDDAPALKEADSDVKRRGLVRDVAGYVFGVESVHLSLPEQADVIQRAYSELFGYGVLDTLLHDDRVTTIQLTGAEKIAVRYAPGEDLTVLEPIFDDIHHVRRTLKRLLIDAGAELRDDVPAIETGLVVNSRPICVNLALPPYTPELSADIRLHPAIAPTLDDLVNSSYLTPKAAIFLKILAQSENGFIIVGDTESGKTTLLSALSPYLSEPARMVSVERAGELRLPEGAKRYTVVWETDEKPGISFAEQVAAALATQPGTLLLDEVRSDEPGAIAPLLMDAEVPRLIWSFRGTSDAKRTRTALAMLARMSDPAQSETRVATLYHRLPFVVTVKRRKGKIELREIAEWQWTPGADYPDYVELLSAGWDGVAPTGKRPVRALSLPEDFWN